MVLAVYRDADGRWMCCADACTDRTTAQWQRCAPGNTDGSNTVPVMACTTHQLPEDVAGHIHQATCTAPPTCNCQPIAPAPPETVHAGG